MSLMKGQKTLVVIGAGNMGEAMLRSWVQKNNNEMSLFVSEPHPSDWLKSMSTKGLIVLNPKLLPREIDICILAVKPQKLAEVLQEKKSRILKTTLVISVVAGKNFHFIQKYLYNEQPIIRVMPNTPVEVNQGISALIANMFTNQSHISCAEHLFNLLGEIVILDDENKIDAVTAISGSGPAYVFNFIENLIESAKDLGLSSEVSKKLIIQTVIGAGILARSSSRNPGKLRENVTSPGGTTQAALEILMDSKLGWKPIIKKATRAARDRSRELAVK